MLVLIFNSGKIKELLKKHPQTKDEKIVPSAVFLARSEKCKEERDYLESLINQAPETKRKYWIDRISLEDEKDHFSSWFEIMLYGWLKQRGDVEIEPTTMIDEKRPDFSMDIRGKKVFFEAKVRMNTINSSKKVSTHVFNGPFPEVFTKFIEPDELKSMLKKSINQHKNLYKSGYAYIICIYLLSPWNDQNQFKEAIFGKEYWSLNSKFTNIIYIGLDNSGLFTEKEELSRMVTGFLIFESQWDSSEKRRILKANYITNPYAEVKIDPIYILHFLN